MPTWRQGDVLLTTAEAEAQDATSYADEVGVSVAVATNRLEEQGRLLNVVEVLQADYPDTFAGAVITDTPDYVTSIRFVGPVPTAARSIVTNAGVQASYDPSATASAAQLEDASDEATASMAESGNTAAIAADLETGEVSVTIQEDGQPARSVQGIRTRAASHRESSRSSDGVTVNTYYTDDKIAQPQDGNTNGGAPALQSTYAPILECTTGFPVKAGVYGEMLAGHCAPDSLIYRTPAGGFIPFNFRGHSEGPYGDFQWNSTPGNPVSGNFFSKVHELRAVNNMQRVWVQGQFLCHFGRASYYSCSHVARTHVSLVRAQDHKTLYHLVAMNTVSSLGGDSGGPWFVTNSYGNMAVGIHFGWVRYGPPGSPRYSAFSKFSYIGSAFPGIAYVCTGQYCT